jgi:hypothetical protein
LGSDERAAAAPCAVWEWINARASVEFFVTRFGDTGGESVNTYCRSPVMNSFFTMIALARR